MSQTARVVFTRHRNKLKLLFGPETWVNSPLRQLDTLYTNTHTPIGFLDLELGSDNQLPSTTKQGQSLPVPVYHTHSTGQRPDLTGPFPRWRSHLQSALVESTARPCGIRAIISPADQTRSQLANAELHHRETIDATADIAHAHENARTEGENGAGLGIVAIETEGTETEMGAGLRIGRGASAGSAIMTDEVGDLFDYVVY